MTDGPILSAFTPSEAESITGVSTTMQRDWRRRGFLPSEQRHARFNVFDLCRLFLLKRLSDRGIGPDKASGVVDIGATELAIETLGCVDAWGFSSSVPHWRGSRDSLIAGAIAEHVANGGNAPMSSAHHAKFVWWADDTTICTGSLDMQLGQMLSDDPRIAGPFVVMDLFALSSTIIDLMPRPYANAQPANVERQSAFTVPGASAPGQTEDINA